MTSKMKDCFLASDYSNLKVIGAGSNGMVYSAKHVTSKKIVAVKKMSFSDKAHCRSVLRELRIRKTLSHENVVELYRALDINGKDIYEGCEENAKDSNAIFLIQEMMETDLHAVLQSYGKLPAEYVKLFVYQILRGLKYIHSTNVVHRDIKPSNILVDSENLMAKIGDFGMSRILDPAYEVNRQLSLCVSSLWYKAPELIVDPTNYSTAIDLWSVGCVFAEMLTGKPVFDGRHDLEQVELILNNLNLSESDKNFLSRSELNNCFLNKFGEDNKVTRKSLFAEIDVEALDLLEKMLTINPKDRITAEEALSHPFLSEYHLPSDEPISLSPLHIEDEVYDLPEACLKELIFKESYELDNKEKLNSSSLESQSFTGTISSTACSSVSQDSLEINVDKDSGYDSPQVENNSCFAVTEVCTNIIVRIVDKLLLLLMTYYSVSTLNPSDH